MQQGNIQREGNYEFWKGIFRNEADVDGLPNILT